MLHWLSLLLGLLLSAQVQTTALPQALPTTKAVNHAVTDTIDTASPEAFYIRESVALTLLMGELAGTDYVANMVSDPEVIALAEDLGARNYGLPDHCRVFLIPLEFIKAIPLLEPKLAIGSVSEALQSHYHQQLTMALPNLLFSSSVTGAQLATFSLLSMSRSFTMPSGFPQGVMVVLTYGEVQSVTAFAQTGENMISATARFSFPGENTESSGEDMDTTASTILHMLELLPPSGYNREQLAALLSQ